ncbi:TetR/AcrR family transcriptional regulator (plasmid) [Pseudonocardia bannensis]|uniref:TetR/AcrR family transcriptional regulator n=1 Tax=Pseudonocardia bannensis TaxID=630973 RepID=A0A848DIQ8_9PSEU|nr:TetR/AcrR family transcriptional regulator [Pseudonocardia bannensis]NMH92455.1 TetR/AcrR family transcriptional regulator [Pseudonocardia bannensis]
MQEDDAEPLNPKTRRHLRRAEIVTAAAQIFAKNGYSNVGMRDIADAVGIRGASLYHHFPSKEEILFAICLTVTREPVEENLPLLDAAGTPSERLANLVRAHVRHLRGRRVEHLVGLHERASLTSEHLAEIDEYRQCYNHRVRDVLTAGMRSGEFRELNPKVVALGMLDMLNGVSGWIRGASDDDVDEVADIYLRLLFDGLRP